MDCEHCFCLRVCIRSDNLCMCCKCGQISDMPKKVMIDIPKSTWIGTNPQFTFTWTGGNYSG